MKLLETNFIEVISEFPDITKFDLANPKRKYYDFYFSALGFEERTIAIPQGLSLVNDFSCNETIYFQYETSTTENAFNEPKLLAYFKRMSNKVSKLFCDEQGFITRLSEIISKKINENSNRPATIMFDISVCSSKLILSVLKALLSLNIELTLTYTEAEEYFPQYSEYIKDPEGFKETATVSDEVVILNPDYSGGNKLNSDLIISFPNFKAQRVKNIISEIDETILLKPDDRLIWIIGDPNMNSIDRDNRKKMMLEINDISSDAKIYEVSTLFYKKTIEKLETIYQNNNLKCHINIADLGSKMQTLAIALYCHIRPEISVYYTSSKTYNTSKFSQGIKDFWIIEFGNTNEVMQKINSIDNISIDIN